MRSISHVLDTKGRDAWHIAPDDSVYNAIKMMADKEVGALLVMEGEKLIGIISERDYARKMILTGRSSPQTPVSQIMTKSVFYVRSDQTVEECMTLMTEKRLRHLPVVDEGRVTGVLSMGDLVKSIITEQKIKIEQLEQYITSG
jgi:CBS domain-containing protein